MTREKNNILGFLPATLWFSDLNLAPKSVKGGRNSNLCAANALHEQTIYIRNKTGSIQTIEKIDLECKNGFLSTWHAHPEPGIRLEKSVPLYKFIVTPSRNIRFKSKEEKAFKIQVRINTQNVELQQRYKEKMLITMQTGERMEFPVIMDPGTRVLMEQNKVKGKGRPRTTPPAPAKLPVLDPKDMVPKIAQYMEDQEELRRLDSTNRALRRRLENQREVNANYAFTKSLLILDDELADVRKELKEAQRGEQRREEVRGEDARQDEAQGGEEMYPPGSSDGMPNQTVSDSVVDTVMNEGDNVPTARYPSKVGDGNNQAAENTMNNKYSDFNGYKAPTMNTPQISSTSDDISETLSWIKNASQSFPSRDTSPSDRNLTGVTQRRLIDKLEEENRSLRRVLKQDKQKQKYLAKGMPSVGVLTGNFVAGMGIVDSDGNTMGNTTDKSDGKYDKNNTTDSDKGPMKQPYVVPSKKRLDEQLLLQNSLMSLEADILSLKQELAIQNAPIGTMPPGLFCDSQQTNQRQQDMQNMQNPTGLATMDRLLSGGSGTVQVKKKRRKKSAGAGGKKKKSEATKITDPKGLAKFNILSSYFAQSGTLAKRRPDQPITFARTEEFNLPSTPGKASLSKIASMKTRPGSAGETGGSAPMSGGFGAGAARPHTGGKVGKKSQSPKTHSAHQPNCQPFSSLPIPMTGMITASGNIDPNQLELRDMRRAQLGLTEQERADWKGIFEMEKEFSKDTLVYTVDMHIAEVERRKEEARKQDEARRKAIAEDDAAYGVYHDNSATVSESGDCKLRKENAAAAASMRSRQEAAPDWYKNNPASPNAKEAEDARTAQTYVGQNKINNPYDVMSWEKGLKQPVKVSTEEERKVVSEQIEKTAGKHPQIMYGRDGSPMIEYNKNHKDTYGTKPPDIIKPAYFTSGPPKEKGDGGKEGGAEAKGANDDQDYGKSDGKDLDGSKRSVHTSERDLNGSAYSKCSRMESVSSGPVESIHPLLGNRNQDIQTETGIPDDQKWATVDGQLKLVPKDWQGDWSSAPTDNMNGTWKGDQLNRTGESVENRTSESIEKPDCEHAPVEVGETINACDLSNSVQVADSHFHEQQETAIFNRSGQIVGNPPKTPHTSMVVGDIGGDKMSESTKFLAAPDKTIPLGDHLLKSDATTVGENPIFENLVQTAKVREGGLGDGKTLDSSMKASKEKSSKEKNRTFSHEETIEPTGNATDSLFARLSSISAGGDADGEGNASIKERMDHFMEAKLDPLEAKVEGIFALLQSMNLKMEQGRDQTMMRSMMMGRSSMNGPRAPQNSMAIQKQETMHILHNDDEDDPVNRTIEDLFALPNLLGDQTGAATRSTRFEDEQKVEEKRISELQGLEYQIVSTLDEKYANLNPNIDDQDSGASQTDAPSKTQLHENVGGDRSSTSAANLRKGKKSEGKDDDEFGSSAAEVYQSLLVAPVASLVSGRMVRDESNEGNKAGGPDKVGSQAAGSPGLFGSQATLDLNDQDEEQRTDVVSLTPEPRKATDKTEPQSLGNKPIGEEIVNEKEASWVKENGPTVQQAPPSKAEDKILIQETAFSNTEMLRVTDASVTILVRKSIRDSNGDEKILKDNLENRCMDVVEAVLGKRLTFCGVLNIAERSSNIAQSVEFSNELSAEFISGELSREYDQQSIIFDDRPAEILSDKKFLSRRRPSAVEIAGEMKTIKEESSSDSSNSVDLSSYFCKSGEQVVLNQLVNSVVAEYMTAISHFKNGTVGLVSSVVYGDSKSENVEAPAQSSDNAPPRADDEAVAIDAEGNEIPKDHNVEGNADGENKAKSEDEAASPSPKRTPSVQIQEEVYSPVLKPLTPAQAEAQLTKRIIMILSDLFDRIVMNLQKTAITEDFGVSELEEAADELRSKRERHRHGSGMSESGESSVSGTKGDGTAGDVVSGSQLGSPKSPTAGAGASPTQQKRKKKHILRYATDLDLNPIFAVNRILLQEPLLINDGSPLRQLPNVFRQGVLPSDQLSVGGESADHRKIAYDVVDTILLDEKMLNNRSIPSSIHSTESIELANEWAQLGASESEGESESSPSFSSATHNRVSQSSGQKKKKRENLYVSNLAQHGGSSSSEVQSSEVLGASTARSESQTEGSHASYKVSSYIPSSSMPSKVLGETSSSGFQDISSSSAQVSSVNGSRAKVVSSSTSSNRTAIMHTIAPTESQNKKDRMAGQLGMGFGTTLTKKKQESASSSAGGSSSSSGARGGGGVRLYNDGKRVKEFKGARGNSSSDDLNVMSDSSLERAYNQAMDNFAIIDGQSSSASSATGAVSSKQASKDRSSKGKHSPGKKSAGSGYQVKVSGSGSSSDPGIDAIMDLEASGGGGGSSTSGSGEENTEKIPGFASSSSSASAKDGISREGSKESAREFSNVASSKVASSMVSSGSSSSDESASSEAPSKEKSIPSKDKSNKSSSPSSSSGVPSPKEYTQKEYSPKGMQKEGSSASSRLSSPTAPERQESNHERMGSKSLTSHTKQMYTGAAMALYGASPSVPVTNESSPIKDDLGSSSSPKYSKSASVETNGSTFMFSGEVAKVVAKIEKRPSPSEAIRRKSLDVKSLDVNRASPAGGTARPKSAMRSAQRGSNAGLGSSQSHSGESSVSVNMIANKGAFKFSNEEEDEEIDEQNDSSASSEVINRRRQSQALVEETQKGGFVLSGALAEAEKELGMVTDDSNESEDYFD